MTLTLLGSKSNIIAFIHTVGYFASHNVTTFLSDNIYSNAIPLRSFCATAWLATSYWTILPLYSLTTFCISFAL